MKLQRVPTFKEINNTIAAAPKTPAALDQAPASVLLPKVDSLLPTIQAPLDALKAAQVKLAQYHSQRFFLFRGIIRFCDNHFGIGSKLTKAILGIQKIATKLLADKEKLTEITTRLAANEELLKKLREDFKNTSAEVSKASVQENNTAAALNSEKNPTVLGLMRSPLKPNAKKIAELEETQKSNAEEVNTKKAAVKELAEKISVLEGLIAEDKAPMTL